jgi:hypothetical protein
MEDPMLRSSRMPHDRSVSTLNQSKPAERISAAGRAVALAGVVLPLLMIGILKFTQIEVGALKPLIGGTPWLAWLYPVFGEAGASYFLGVFELVTAALLSASPWSARAGVAGGALGALIFAVTVSIAAVEEQTAATQEIAQNVSAATDRSRQAAQNVSAVLSAADKTSDEVDHVENVSEQLGAITKDIQSKLDQFVQGLAAAQRTAPPSKSAA